MSRGASANGSVGTSGLPAGFTEISGIIRKEVRLGTFVNVVGVVTDCRLPTTTGGKDFKSTLTLRSVSTEGLGDEQIDFIIFRPEAEMPHVASADVVVVYQAKVQQFKTNPFSLLCHHTTKIRTYTASRIPKPPNPATVALVPATRRDNKAPTDEVHRYVSYVFHNADKDELPNEIEFTEKARLSLNIKPKFSLLKDVKDGQFCDIIAQVARKPYDLVDKIALYVSDYTENGKFFHYSIENVGDLVSKAGHDPYGYTRSTQGDESKASDDTWVGPYGKKVIQITCYDPHASFIRTEVQTGDWIFMRNVQIKYGHNGQNLEGFLRGSQNYNERINVDLLYREADQNSGQDVDPRLKDAFRRWRDETKKRRQQLKAIEDAAAVGAKRKATEAVGEPHPLEPKNKMSKGQSKGQSKRQKKRERIKQEAEKALLEQQRAQEEGGGSEQNDEPEQDQELLGSLNRRVTCESHPSASLSSIASILKPVYCETEIKDPDAKLLLPFVCAKYQARVRVVDFFPNALESFACSRKPAKWGGVLSDEDSDLPSHYDDDHSDGTGGQLIWEWRFALQLEDAENVSRSRPRERVWVVVNNAEAQCLTNMDATNLRRDAATLAQLRERMFTLWGNLEELKRVAAAGKKEKQGGPKAGGRLNLDKPPLDSSDSEDNGDALKGLSNKPFICYIRQYGVRNGGGGRAASTGSDESDVRGRWTRVFGLFGTRISS